MCCGCGACFQTCPKKCIDMKSDSEGFSYPEIKKDLCINCGLCEKVCPVINYKSNGESVLNTYIGYTSDEKIRSGSSSGGLFSILAEQILNENGIVFGAAFDDDFLVHHIGIEKIADLCLIQGSKYLQSRTENTYLQAKEALEQGRKVLYSGTACQIAGLKSFLKKEYENLLTVDVLCHGVPSPSVWKNYLEYREKEYQSKVKNVSFRKKFSGWKQYSVEIIFESGKIYTRKFYEDNFMQAFLRDICLRPSCHDCRFKALERPSDITLGDCWGVENYMPDMDDNKGTSVILIHSEKGGKLFDSASDSLNFKTAEKDKALPPTADSRKSVSPHKNRSRFFERFSKGENIIQLKGLYDIPLSQKFVRKLKKFFKKLFV